MERKIGTLHLKNRYQYSNKILSNQTLGQEEQNPEHSAIVFDVVNE